MNKMLWAVALTAMATGGTGCAQVRGPAGKQVSALVACGPALSQGPEHCAPGVGRRLELDKYEPPLNLYNSGVPQALAYIGTVVPKGDRRGLAGINCGAPVVPARSPFVEGDIVGFPVPGGPNLPNESDESLTYEQDYTLERTFEGKVQVSLENALLTAQVPPAVVERLKGDISVAASNVKSVASSVRGAFKQYQLQPELIAELQSDEVSPRLADCARMLATEEWEMYQAISGWKVDEATYASNETTRISAQLAAKVAAIDPTVNLADVTAKLDAQAKNAIRTKMSPTFRVVGVSYYNPIRLGTAGQSAPE